MNFENKDTELSLSERFARMARDFDDLQREMAGLDTGRISRFLPKGAASADPSGRGKRDRTEALSQLQMAILNPAYAQLFADTQKDLVDAQSRLDVLLERVSAEILRSEAALDETLDNAASLPDGTKVFKDRNGDVRTQDGVLVAAELAATILWTGNEPSFEDFQSQASRLSRLNELEGDIRAGQAEIGDMQAAMEDEDNPPEARSLDAFGQRAKEIADDLDVSFEATVNQAAPSAEPDQSLGRATTAIVVPEL
ncbi:MAG: hypothetical protein AAF870_06565 [Pseudomonadota bacterium]